MGVIIGELTIIIFLLLGIIYNSYEEGTEAKQKNDNSQDEGTKDNKDNKNENKGNGQTSIW